MPKIRCVVCRKALGLMGLRCRCGADLCSAHILHEAHTCTFDCKSNGRDRLAADNQPVIRPKVAPI
jgi:predicted nucleic acid binding AN1-type Zn finger protein